jgi:putative transposase
MTQYLFETIVFLWYHEVMKKEDNGRYMAIDLGVNNLITCFTSAGKSIIVSGRQLLSLNRYYDKKTGYYQSISYADQVKSGEKHPRDSRRIQKLYEKRRKQVLHLLHAATKHVIDFAEREGIIKIIIGNITHKIINIPSPAFCLNLRLSSRTERSFAQ